MISHKVCNHEPLYRSFASVTTCRAGPLNEANGERKKGERKGKRKEQERGRMREKEREGEKREERRGKERKGEERRGREKEEGVTVCIPGYGWLRLSVWT